MKIAAALKKISDTVDNLVAKAVIGLIVLMILTITLQILSRTLAQAFVWTEEFSRYLLVWSTFLGATLAYKRGMHISVEFIRDTLPAGLRIGIILAGNLLSIIFFGVAVYNGISLMAMQIFQVSPAMQLPMRWVYLGVPLGFVVMMIHAAALTATEFGKKEEAAA